MSVYFHLKDGYWMRTKGQRRGEGERIRLSSLGKFCVDRRLFKASGKKTLD